MRAAMCNAYGPPEDVVVVDVPDPVAGPGEVLVDIHYGAVNFPDVLICSNDYQLSVPVPFVPGSEYSGVVAEVGEGVTQWSPGDRVSGSTFVGAFAERIAVPAGGDEERAVLGEADRQGAEHQVDRGAPRGELRHGVDRPVAHHLHVGVPPGQHRGQARVELDGDVVSPPGEAALHDPAGRAGDDADLPVQPAAHSAACPVRSSR